VFNAFGAQIRLFQSGPRILPTEGEDVSTAVAAAFRESGTAVREDFGSIESFEETPAGIRMHFSKNTDRESAQAMLAVVAIGWVANTAELELSKAGVEINARGFISIDEFLRTSVANIFAAADVTGRLMLVPQAIQDGFVAATNAAFRDEAPGSACADWQFH
jgi:pyruvate/2-oxoglutarate dehydrogenase complex dihydrolipoamide dehydrogenase (E3) component